jgi:ABC-type nitrate/sulfonate/bicarbonate transport system substrate-binding protein
MIAGDFKMGEMSTATYAIACDNGQMSGKILSGIARDKGVDEAIGTNFLFIRSQSDINSPHDLIGKKVGVPGIQSSATNTFLGFLKEKYGITPDQLTLVDKSNSVLIELLRQGEVDASILGQNVGAQAYYDFAFKMIWNLNVEFEQEYGASCIPTLFVVDPLFYEENSYVVIAAYDLLQESNRYVASHITEIAQAFIAEFNTGLPVEFYENFYKYHGAVDYARMDTTNLSCVTGMFRLLQSNGVINATPDSTEMLIDMVVESIKYKRSY